MSVKLPLIILPAKSFPIYFCFNEVEKMVNPELKDINGQNLIWSNIKSKIRLNNNITIRYWKRKNGSPQSQGNTKSFSEFIDLLSFFVNNTNNQEETKIDEAKLDSVDLIINSDEFLTIQTVKKWCEKKIKFIDYF